MTAWETCPRWTTYKKRQLTRGLIALGGAAAAGVGGAYWLLNVQDPTWKALVVGGLVGLGTIGIVVPFLIDPHPIKANERSRLVDEYNEQLREELGLPKARPTSLGATFSAGGWFSADGGGARFAGTF
ncbi:MAG: hypothetical protein Q8P18_26380 [Pseudomonadota bacterium]|nr:hypothetical protein [Pseudomonadota bacterium]